MADDYSSLYSYILIFEDAQGGWAVPRIRDISDCRNLNPPPPVENPIHACMGVLPTKWGRGVNTLLPSVPFLLGQGSAN